MPRKSNARRPSPASPPPGARRAAKVVVFPGTFDPITLGHLDLIERGRKLFDHLIIAIGVNPEKDHLFPVHERLEIVQSLIRPLSNVSVETYEGLTVDFVRKHRAAAILRGLRNLTDLDYEFRVALTNRKVGAIETVFIMTREEFGFTSSSLIKQIVTLGGDPHSLKELLPTTVIERLIHYRKNKLGPFGRAPRDSLDT